MLILMDAILEPLVASPQLPRYVEDLQNILAAEAQRRSRFYQEMDGIKKVEFINGEVVMHSPAQRRHNSASLALSSLLDYHVTRRELGWVGNDNNLVCLARNDYEPDVCFFGRTKADQLTPEQMRLPAPDFAAEVLSPSTQHHDRSVKFQDYAVHGVSEYWIIDPVAESVEQYSLENAGNYRLLGTWTGADMIASVAVPSFQIPARALFDPQAKLAALNALIAASSESG